MKLSFSHFNFAHFCFISSVFFISSTLVLSLDLHLLKSSMSLLNFWEIQTIPMITVMSLSAYSNICFGFKSVLIDFSPQYKLCFTFSLHA